jgi:hypothetical protein
MMHDRGVMMMGFEEEETAHHAYRCEYGGTLPIGVRDASDSTIRRSRWRRFHGGRFGR